MGEREVRIMRYATQILTKNDCYLAGRPLNPEGIIVHSTGVDQKRIDVYTSQWNRGGVRVCVHGFLGLDSEGALCFTQTLPYTMRCWGCGSGVRGSWNDRFLQLEICETLNDGAWCRETYAAALEVCAGLCVRFGIAPEAVVTHSEAYAAGYASNHGDVMHWWPRHGLSMDGFRRELKAMLEEDDKMLNNEENYQVFRSFMARYEAEQGALPASDWAKTACSMAVQSGLFTDGNGDGTLDRPQSALKRQEFAAVLDRIGVLG